jgi:hypothetical protein
MGSSKHPNGTARIAHIEKYARPLADAVTKRETAHGEPHMFTLVSRWIVSNLRRLVEWPKLAECRTAAIGSMRLVGDVFAYRFCVFRFPVSATAVIRFCVQPESLLAMQAAKVVLDVVVPCCAFREFDKRDGDPRAVEKRLYECFIGDVLRGDLYRFAQLARMSDCVANAKVRTSITCHRRRLRLDFATFGGVIGRYR